MPSLKVIGGRVEKEQAMDAKTQMVKIKNRFGLHMRPVAEISKLTHQFDASVAFHKGDLSAQGHSVVEMLMLGAFCGDELKVSAVGKDAEEALAAVVHYVTHYKDDQSPHDGDLGTCAA